MNVSKIMAGALAVLALSAPVAMAEDYAGGAIKTADVAGQEILTDANGMSLYTFDMDKVDGASPPYASTCYDDCAVKWPPALAAADAVADGEFTLVDRTDGTKQWAHGGWPLYLWFKDTAPGDISGDNAGKVWHLAKD